jgi:hypothetical protein
LHRHDGLVALGLEEIPPFLTRSAFAGSQRYGAILWSGDIESTFDELAVQVQLAQHVAMSGIYWWCVISHLAQAACTRFLEECIPPLRKRYSILWELLLRLFCGCLCYACGAEITCMRRTTDIGGFRNGNPTDPTFRELIVRWFQFGGAFSSFPTRPLASVCQLPFVTRELRGCLQPFVRFSDFMATGRVQRIMTFAGQRATTKYGPSGKLHTGPSHQLCACGRICVTMFTSTFVAHMTMARHFCAPWSLSSLTRHVRTRQTNSCLATRGWSPLCCHMALRLNESISRSSQRGNTGDTITRTAQL